MSHPQQHPRRFDSVDAFGAWERAQPGTWELHDGEAVALVSEGVDHITIKANLRLALDEALHRDRTGCELTANGSTVRVADDQRFQPDIMVSWGERASYGCREAEMPIIVVEVLSPATQQADVSVKLDGYFRLPSVRHYLIVSFEGRLVVHHRRPDGPSLVTTLHSSGTIILDPPGISIDVEGLYRGTDVLEPTSLPWSLASIVEETPT